MKKLILAVAALSALTISSAQGGFDLEQSGFYLGTRASQLGAPPQVVQTNPGVTPPEFELQPERSGLEIDAYGGYGFDLFSN